ncbi:class I SAM-dependent methyltransferase [Bradyrhizobium sp. STM 3557]|uniref:class I SAM-dependent methyltransferase n=1 Tax=Bradyrhizobium sp. STM 3557 TaxID=578920 RepID=UPI00388F6165
MSAPAGSGAKRDALLGAIGSDVDAYYTARVARHGATPLGVDWSCQATQALRFVQLLKLCDFTKPFSLNDLGCGYGALVPFLSARHSGCEVDYLGIDLSRAMIGRARRRFAGPQRRFIVGAKSPRIADYSVASGIMNVNVGYSRQDWETFVRSMLRQMRESSRRGFAVNFMMAGPEEADDESGVTRLYRTTPEPWMRFCEIELQCRVELISNYGMKEFTLLVRCDAAAAPNTLQQ